MTDIRDLARNARAWPFEEARKRFAEAGDRERADEVSRELASL